MTALRIQSTLPNDVEDLIHRVIGAFLAVHKELGPGMSEAVYAAAAKLELMTRKIPFEHEKIFPVRYRGKFLRHQRLDLLVDKRLVVEIKSVERLHPIYKAQVVSYMRVAEVRAGLLVNFNVPLLKQGIQRVVL
jgi:GxxExxY protein